MYTQKNNPFSRTPFKKIDPLKKSTDPNKKLDNNDNWIQKTLKEVPEGEDGKRPMIPLVAKGIKNRLSSRISDIKKGVNWYLDADGDGTVSKGEVAMEAATTFFPIGKIGKVLSLGNKVKKASKAKNLITKPKTKGKFNMDERGMLDHVESHGTPYRNMDINPNSTDPLHVTDYWKQVNKEGFKHKDVASNKLVYAADDISNSKNLGYKYLGDISNRSIMEITTDGGKKVSFLRSTGGGGKSLNWVDEVTGKKYKVESTGINYPVMDKVHHINQNTGKMGAGHWYKHDRGGHLGNWYDGYGIKNFDELGKGNFVPKKDGAGNLVFNQKGVLQGRWDGGKIGDELIKQTTTIITP